MWSAIYYCMEVKKGGKYFWEKTTTATIHYNHYLVELPIIVYNCLQYNEGKFVQMPDEMIY